MIKDLLKNIDTLRKAIGNEPMSHIIGNAYRKVRGLEPILLNHNDGLHGYDKYCAQRAKIMHARSLQNIQHTAISILWVVDSWNIEKLKSSYQSMLQQRMPIEEIILVCDQPSVVLQLGVSMSFDILSDAMTNSTGDYICLLHNTVQLYDTYTQEIARDIQKHGDVDILYTCEDLIDEKGRRSEAQFKPELNVDLLYANNYIGKNITFKTQFALDIDGFDIQSHPQAYVYDFLLRATERKADIRRVEEVLYGEAPFAQQEPLAACKQVLEQHVHRVGRAAEIVDGKEQGTMRVKYLFQEKPAVSIIIPYKDQVDLLQQCVDSILTRTDYQNYEIILVDNGSEEEETLRYSQELVANRLNVHLLRLEMDFNFSALNNAAVAQSKSEFVLFLNNDTQVINREWLGAMVKELQRAEVGVVGAKLLYADGTVQHAGVLYGVGHVAGHSFRTLDDEDGGHMQRANLTQEYMAVTGACLMTKRTLFDRLEGFDEVNLKVAYNDVDYCLSVHQLGYKVIYTPHARLFHYESKSRASDLSEKERDRYDKECIFMKTKWEVIFKVDPFFHPHLDERLENFRIREKDA